MTAVWCMTKTNQATVQQVAEPIKAQQQADGQRDVRPLLGNEAIARGVWEAGVKVATAYPGTPSTEILESLGRYPADEIEVQWGTNEKVALDVAIGASFTGVRAFVSMKHVGLNVAYDSLMSVTYIGVNGALVLAVCDDPGIHSSQNEQDSRMLARIAMVPILEPADAQEALDFTRIAFEISEQFDTPVIVRSTTRLSHTRSRVRIGSRMSLPDKDFIESTAKNVMVPAHARQRHPLLLEREKKLTEYFNTSPLNQQDAGHSPYGIITAGISYSYVKEVVPEARVLKLAVTWPLPSGLLREFCDSVERVLVVEELEPVIEDELRKMGIAVEGKSLFPRVGEYSPAVIQHGLVQAGILQAETAEAVYEPSQLARPPVLCPGCPHTSSYMVLRSVNARVAGDIGCYTLASIEPLDAVDTCVAMGCSIANAVGMAKANNQTRPIVATIGDSTFLHSGIPPLIDAVYNKADVTVMILDNHTVAMTGGQDYAGTGITLRGEKTERVNFKELVQAIGVKWVQQIDSYNLAEMHKALKEAIQFKGVAVLISDRPCVIDPIRIRGAVYQITAATCTGCQSCMNLGCPSLAWTDEMVDGHHKVAIDTTTCMGCSLCAQICPSDAIHLPEAP